MNRLMKEMGFVPCTEEIAAAIDGMNLEIELEAAQKRIAAMEVQIIDLKRQVADRDLVIEHIEKVRARNNRFRDANGIPDAVFERIMNDIEVKE